MKNTFTNNNNGVNNDFFNNLMKAELEQFDKEVEEINEEPFKCKDFRGTTDYNDLLTLIGEDNAVKVSSDANEKVGTTTKSANSFSALYLLGNDPATLKIKSDILNIVFKKGLRKSNMSSVVLPKNPGNKEYKGIAIEKLTKNIEIDMVIMDESKDAQIELLLEMYNSLYHPASVDRIILDLVNYHRVYQEKIIDAAKKLYEVFSLFFSMFLRANSALDIKIVYQSMKKLEKDLSDNTPISLISRHKHRFAGQTGEYRIFKNKKTNEDIKLSFQDDLANIQDTFFASFETFLISLVEKYKMIKYSPELTNLFAKTGSELSTVLVLHNNVIKPYNTIASTIAEKMNRIRIEEMETYSEDAKKELEIRKENLKELRRDSFEKLSNIARYITRDLTMEEAGLAMLQASLIRKVASPSVELIHIVGKWYVNPESANRAYENIAPELFMQFMMNKYEQHEAVSRIECSKATRESLVEGQELTFVRGVCSGMAISLNSEDAGEAGEMDELKATVRIIDGEICVAIPMTFERVVVDNVEDLTGVFVPVYDLDKYITGSKDAVESKFNEFANIKVNKINGKNSNVVMANCDGKEVCVAKYNTSTIFKNVVGTNCSLFMNDYSSMLLIRNVEISKDDIEEAVKDTVTFINGETAESQLLAQIAGMAGMEGLFTAAKPVNETKQVEETNLANENKPAKTVEQVEESNEAKQTEEPVSETKQEVNETNSANVDFSKMTEDQLLALYGTGMDEEYSEGDMFITDEMLF